MQILFGIIILDLLLATQSCLIGTQLVDFGFLGFPFVYFIYFLRKKQKKVIDFMKVISFSLFIISRLGKISGWGYIESTFQLAPALLWITVLYDIYLNFIQKKNKNDLHTDMNTPLDMNL